jgi:hypothetical protein
LGCRPLTRLAPRLSCSQPAPACGRPWRFLPYRHLNGSSSLQRRARGSSSRASPPLGRIATRTAHQRTFASLCALDAVAAEALQAVAPRRITPQQPPLAATPTPRDAQCAPQHLLAPVATVAPVAVSPPYRHLNRANFISASKICLSAHAGTSAIRVAPVTRPRTPTHHTPAAAPRRHSDSSRRAARPKLLAPVVPRGARGGLPLVSTLEWVNFALETRTRIQQPPSPPLGLIATQLHHQEPLRVFALLAPLRQKRPRPSPHDAPHGSSRPSPPLGLIATRTAPQEPLRVFALLAPLRQKRPQPSPRTTPQQPPLAATPTHRDAHCAPHFLGESWRSLAPWRQKRSQSSPRPAPHHTAAAAPRRHSDASRRALRPQIPWRVLALLGALATEALTVLAPRRPRYTDGEARPQCRTARNAAPRDAFPEQRARPRVRPPSIDLSRSVR